MDDLATLDRRIASAWAALVGARAVASRCPNAETIRIEDMCERVVNELLEARWEMQRVDAMVRA